jgi:hypothetical protein
VIGDWQSRNYEGIESPLGYTIRRGRWTDRPVWKQYTTWWIEVSVIAGFGIDHPFLWYLLLWIPDPNNVSRRNVFILSGSVTGVSFVTNIPAGNITVGCEFLRGNISLGNVSGVSTFGGLALGFAFVYNNPTSYSIDISGEMASSEIDACELGMFCDSNQNTYGLCSGVDIYELSLSHPLLTFSDIAFCDTDNNIYYCIGG